MRGLRTELAALTLLFGCVVGTAHADKVMYHDETTGVEMWRMTNCASFHEYCHADKPWSRDGSMIVALHYQNGAGVVVVDTRDGTETIIGKNHKHPIVSPAFVRGLGHRGVVYNAFSSTRSQVYLYNLDTGKERFVCDLPGDSRMLAAGVIGSPSEVVFRRRLDDRMLWDTGVKSLTDDSPPRVMHSIPDCNETLRTVSPDAERHRFGLSIRPMWPDFRRRAVKGELAQKEYQLSGECDGYIAEYEQKTGKVTKRFAERIGLWAHEAWSGDGKYLVRNKYMWRADDPEPIRLIWVVEDTADVANHYGTCGRSGRYLAGDHGGKFGEHLSLTDIWTGEIREVARVSTSTEPGGGIGQDHGHPAGSPDGTKVLVHSSYDLVNHRLYAIPTRDVKPGDATIPVETTEGFADKGKLLIGYGYRPGPRLRVRYGRKDATSFHDCTWPEDAEAALKKNLKSTTAVIPKGSDAISDFYGRLHAEDKRVPRREYVAVVKQPDPPRSPMARRTAAGVELTWREPISHIESAGYVVYRKTDAAPLTPVNPEPVKALRYVDKDPLKGRAEYFVRSVEYSGLYGSPSGSAWVDGDEAGVNLVDSYDVPDTIFMTAEEGLTPERLNDRRTVRVHVPIQGEYVLWARGRAWKDSESVRVTVDGEPLPDVIFKGTDWHWAKVGPRVLSAGEHLIEFRREVSYEIPAANLVKNGSFEEGLEGWESQGAPAEVDATRAHAGKQSIRFAGKLTNRKVSQRVRVEDKPEWYYRMSVRVRGAFTEGSTSPVKDAPPFGRMSVELGGFPWARRSCQYSFTWENARRWKNQDWYHVDLLFTSKRRRQGVRPLEQIVVTPAHFCWFFGEQAGEVWVDDVKVTEAGPRVRPVKVTKVLLTNLTEYVPSGVDGREAHPFPQPPVVAAVADLRQTGRARNTVAVAWQPGRLGARGYHVYAREIVEGKRPAVPTTKYHRITSVWNQTSVTIPDLKRAARYLVKVTAINEDGVQGPAAQTEVATGGQEPERITMEAEAGRVSAPMVVNKSDGVTFVVTPNADPEKRPDLYDRKNEGRKTGSVALSFTIKEGGEYGLCCRLFMPDGGSNSLFWTLDGEAQSFWTAPTGKWLWSKRVLQLKPGRHSLTFRTREAGSGLDKVIVTNDMEWVNQAE